MNDEEMNEIIARNDGEVEIFRQMDIQRARDQKNAWQLAGRSGPPPQPLIQLEELPECYQNDEPFVNKDAEEELEGRGHRKRAVVTYNDGLSDDAWAMVETMYFFIELLADSIFRLLKVTRILTMSFRGMERKYKGGSQTNLYVIMMFHQVVIHQPVMNDVDERRRAEPRRWVEMWTMR